MSDGFRGRLMPQPTQTFAGFGYPLNVLHRLTPQALFHAWNAHGVPLTELCTCLEASALYELAAPVRFIFREIAVSRGNSKSPRNSRYEALFLKKSSTKIKVISFHSSLVLSQGYHFCGYRPDNETGSPVFSSSAVIVTLTLRWLPKTCHRVSLNPGVAWPFQEHATPFVFFTFLLPKN